MCILGSRPVARPGPVGEAAPAPRGSPRPAAPAAEPGSRPIAAAAVLAVLVVAVAEALRVPAAALTADAGLLPLVLGRSVVGVAEVGVGVLLLASLTGLSAVGARSEAGRSGLIALGAVAAGGSMVLTVAINPRLARAPSLHFLFATLALVAGLSLRRALRPPRRPSRAEAGFGHALVALALAATAALLWINPRIHQHYPAFHVAVVQATLLLAFVGFALLLTRRPRAPGRPTGAAVGLGAAVLAGLAAGAAVPDARADARYRAHTMPGLWERVRSPGEPVPADDPEPDPAWTDPDGALGRFAAGSRLPALPEGFDLGEHDVLVITAEALRFDATSLGGQPPTTTPALAELARESLSFTRAYAASSGTLHSMSAVHAMGLPSTLPVETWRRSWNGELGAASPRAARAFAAAGYETFWIGHDYERAFRDVILGFEGGFDEVDRVPSLPSSADTDAEVADRVIERLERPADGRFFGWVFLESPHAAYVEHYDDMPADTPRDVYQQEVRYLDAQLGRILGALRERGRLDRTIVVFTGDHGEEFGEHGGTKHKRTVYEESTRVPLVVHVPGVEPRVLGGPTSVPYVLPWLMLRGPRALADPARERVEAVFAPFMRATDDAVVVELLGHHEMRTALVWPERKVIYDYYSGLVEVYGADDPGDQRDLAVDPRVRRAVEPLLGRYRALRDELARYGFRPRYMPGRE